MNKKILEIKRIRKRSKNYKIINNKIINNKIIANSQRGEIITPLLFIFLIFMIIVINIYAQAVNSLVDVNYQIEDIQNSYNKKVECIDEIYLSQKNKVEKEQEEKEEINK